MLSHSMSGCESAAPEPMILLGPLPGAMGKKPRAEWTSVLLTRQQSDYGGDLDLHPAPIAFHYKYPESKVLGV
jgi:hypothetical protein